MPINPIINLSSNRTITKCIYCESMNIVHYGKYRDRQRFKCKDCNRSFNTLSDTPFARTRYLDKWPEFAECLGTGLSLRKSSKILKVSYVTLFYWRHKLLSGLANIPLKNFTDRIEMQAMYVLPSQKGKRNIPIGASRKRGYSIYSRHIFNDKKICIINAKDKQNNILSKVANYGLLDLITLEKLVNNYISKTNTICSKLPRIFRQLAIVNKAEYVDLPPFFQCKNGFPDIVNYEISFKAWIKRFKGVATKYLNNYLALFKFLQVYTRDITSILLKLSSTFSKMQTFYSIRKFEFYC